MPKLVNRPPKYARMGKYAFVTHKGKRVYLGRYGSPESHEAYNRFLAERRLNPNLIPPRGESNGTVKELAAAFLDHAEATLAKPNYTHHRIAVLDFLTKFYGDVPVDEFRASSLKTVRSELVRAVGKDGKPRFCRGMINDYVCRIVRIFGWGVAEELVKPDTWAVLKAVKPLPKGYAGTVENPAREDVPDNIIGRTLPYMPPVLRAMVQVQRLTGARPSEIFGMRVGQIDKDTVPDLWLYRLSTHKTENKTKQKKIIPLGKPEQELILPYLAGKKPEEAVFSPRMAIQERRTEQRANRKSKPTPSQITRSKERAAKPSRYREFYNKDSYRQAVAYAIEKANRHLPDGEKIPYWTPYQLRHAAATAMEEESGLDEAQALLDHSSAQTTKRYAHARLQKMKELARNRRNPFDEAGQAEQGGIVSTN